MAKAILVADCGSTSCEWRLIADGNVSSLPHTRGFNPTYEPAENLMTELALYREFSEIEGLVDRVYYYGAGCASETAKSKVHEALNNQYSHAAVEVNSDLWGAVLAVYTGERVICGILGTGSNACLFDGARLNFMVPSLGYILGDEGSGNHIGRQLLKGYFYQEMPAKLRSEFEKKFHLELDEVLKATYRSGNASTYLAHFAVFANEHGDDSFIRNLVTQSLRSYLIHFITGIEGYQTIPLRMVGSIAHYFEEIIRAETSALGINLDTILRRPIDQLAAYHLRNG